jgi:hypothetical protein
MADFAQIRDEGEIAHFRGSHRNPYPEGSSSAAAWQAGHSDGERQTREDRAAEDAARQTMHDENAHLWAIWNDAPSREPTE